MFRKISKKLYLAEHFVQLATLNTVTSLTVNSIMDIFLQVLQNFQNTASKSGWKASFFENCIHLTLKFFGHNLIFRKEL